MIFLDETFHFSIEEPIPVLLDVNKQREAYIRKTHLQKSHFFRI